MTPGEVVPVPVHRSEVVRAEVLPNGLTPPELARVANQEHHQAVESCGLMVWHAIRSGEALMAVKAQLRHGEWLPWLEANFESDERTARRYMELFRNRTRVSDLEDGSIRQALRAISSNASQVTNNTGDTEWFTPKPFIDAARRVMDGIDLDPASTPEANEVVQATAFYTQADNGLIQPWKGRVWMNPPYASDLIYPFCERLADSYAEGDVTEACVLVNSATETAWWQRLAEVAAGLCFPPRRVKFWHPEKDGEAGPLQGQTVFYFGPKLDLFRTTFIDLGTTASL